MANMQLGVAVVDKDLKIQLWNRRAEDLWGVRSDEAVGQPLLALDIGLPMAEVGKPLREALAGSDGHRTLEVQATNRRGKRFTCRIQAAAMMGASGSSSVILLMEAVEGSGEEKPT
jgi:two-component system CheB/CheR fusion protein